MSIPAVITGGFGTFGGVEYLPTFGYGDFTAVPAVPSVPGCVTLAISQPYTCTLTETLVHTVTLTETQIGSVTLSITCCGDC